MIRTPVAVVVCVLSVAACAPLAGQQRVVADRQAAAFVGQTVAVEGTVAGVHVSRRSGTIFLNFGAAYPNETFTAVIFRSAASRFPNPEQWEGKRVRVSGRVRLYRGKPEVVLETPTQLAPATR